MLSTSNSGSLQDSSRLSNHRDLPAVRPTDASTPDRQPDGTRQQKLSPQERKALRLSNLPVGNTAKETGAWQDTPLSARSADAKGTPKASSLQFIGTKSLPAQSVPKPTDARLDSPDNPPPPATDTPATDTPTIDRRPDWARQHKLSPDEWEALILAGLDATQLDACNDWPLPDDTARHVQAQEPAAKSGKLPPEGWVEVSVKPTSGATQHHWFMPITTMADLRRLRQGRFLMALADALGTPGVVPPLHAFIHRVNGRLVYGMLVPFDLQALSAADAGLNPQRPGLVSQCVALDWLAFLTGQRIEPEDLVWVPQGDGYQLRWRLPPQGVVTATVNDGAGADRPALIDRDMLDHLQQMDTAGWGEQALPALGTTGGRAPAQAARALPRSRPAGRVGARTEPAVEQRQPAGAPGLRRQMQLPGGG